MFRPATRLITRPAALRAVSRAAAAPTRRFLSIPPPTQKSRSWKSLAARIGIVGTIIYYYNTTEVFAEEPRQTVQSLPETDVEATTLPTIEDVAEERQRRKAEMAAAQQKEEVSAQDGDAAPAGGVEQLEEEAGQQGAFNPETGEINWDCPCLGGMADGPCGDEFKAAFSCFVFSTEEPKGMDCIEKFKGMQNCFREYPEIYGAELESEEEEDDGAIGVAQPETGNRTETAPSEQASLAHQASSDSASREGASQKKDHSLVPESYRASGDAIDSKTKTQQVRREHEPVSESEDIVPKAAVDATQANEEKK